MPQHRETRRMPYTAEQMFDLVADIGRYPEFLPWIIAMRIRTPHPGHLWAGTHPEPVDPAAHQIVTADMVVGFKAIREHFTSRVTLDRARHVHVDYLDGPLKYLHNDWHFRDVPGGCEIDFAVEFEFKTKMFEKIAGMFFGDALRKMVASFEARAAAIYPQVVAG